MHRIVKSHLDSFVKENAIENDDESIQFEKFCNYCFLQPRIAAKIDLDDVTTNNDDDGIDGIALVINEDIVQAVEDAEIIFDKNHRNNDVELVFIQAKRTEGYDLGDFLKFKDAVLRFLSQQPYRAASSLQQDVRSAFDKAIDNVPKIRGGAPLMCAYYITTGEYGHPTALETAKREMCDQISALGYFSGLDVRIFGRDDLIKAWVASYSGIEASLIMHSYAGLPQIEGIEEAYLAVVKARDYIDNILTGDDGSIRSQLFEDNVRHFLGIDNPVNKSIAATINDKNVRTRFPVLNNGVTIVSPDVVVKSNKLFIRDFQIVNGCQTSHVLFENRELITDELMVTLKIVETDDEDVYGELVRATNNQSQIKEPQFLSLSPIARKVEAYFNTFEGQEGRLYFERRERQYVGRGVPAIRIIDIDAAARAVCAMYLLRPDLAFKYPKQMYETLGGKLFKDGNKEAIYFSSALVLYRIHLLTSNGAVTNLARKYKWHVLPIVGVLVAGNAIPELNSRAADAFANKIIDLFQTHSDQIIEVLDKAVKIIISLGDVSTDILKRQSTITELLEKTS